MRCFIAIPINQTVTELLLNRVEQIQNLDWNANIRWFPAKNFHLTLQFLGAKLEPSKIDQVIDIFEKQLASNLRSISITLQRIELFPDRENAHTVIASVKSSKELILLAEKVSQQMATIGLEKSKLEFRPHISLGRISKNCDTSQIMIPQAIAQLNKPKLQVKQLILFKSQLTNQAPIYTILNIIKLTDKNNHES